MSQEVEVILKLSVSVTAAIIGWITVLKPAVTAIRNKRQSKRDAIERVLHDDKLYRKTVLDKLGDIEVRLEQQDETLATMQRSDIERAYCMFVLEHGYCPSGMKASIADVYDQYSAKGYNHISKNRVDELMALPEFPPRRKEQS